MMLLLVIATSFCVVTAALVIAMCRTAKIGDEQTKRRHDARPE